jgi:geranylgeranyl reductase family protein
VDRPQPEDRQPDELDVLVVGAGPAGVAAAITAHERGLRTRLVDKASFPRDKTCGDGLTAQALRLLERLGLDVPSLDGFMSVHETVLVAPGGRQVSLPLPPDVLSSAVVPRFVLDDALVARARAAGVDVRLETPVTALDAGRADGRVRVETGTPGQTVLARHVIAADGHWSAVRRLREPTADADLGTWHAARQYFRGVGDARQWVLFEPDLLPGYAWVFPLPGRRANVGFGVLREDGVTGKRLKALWSELLTRPSLLAVLGPDAEPEGPYRAWPIPTSLHHRRLTDDPILYVGDAAGVVDPMTGEGIAQALETGMLAAETIALGGDPARVGARYRRSVERDLGRDLRFATRLQRVLRSPWGAGAAIRAAGLTPWTRREFARWMFEDYPRALLLTPDRWRRDMFAARGAYAHS